MTQDIVERLRSQFHLTQGDGLNALLATGDEAADLIEQLRADNERQVKRIAELEGAIEPFALHINPSIPGNKLIDTVAYTADQHRAALAAQQKEVG